MRKNRGPAAQTDHLKAFWNWKWYDREDSNPGEVRVFEIDDDDLPERLVGCGRLIAFRYRVPITGNVRSNPSKEFRVPSSGQQDSFLFFDLDDPGQRLYPVLSEKARGLAAASFYRPNPFAEISLPQLAKMTGGRQAKGVPYPDVMVKPIGVASAAVYEAEKRDDGKSLYIHRFGEETGVRPVLAMGNDGRIWLAGGDYTCPTPGITN